MQRYCTTVLDGPSTLQCQVLCGQANRLQRVVLEALTQPSQAQTLKREMMFRVLFYLGESVHMFGSAAKPKGVKAIIGSN